MLCDYCKINNCKFRNDGRTYCFSFLGYIEKEISEEEKTKLFLEEFNSLCKKYKIKNVELLFNK